MRKKLVPHPGSVIRSAIQGRSTITALAKHLDTPRPQFASLINGRGRISPLLSLKLDEAFGKPHGFWSTVQFNYDLARAKSVKRKKLRPIRTASQPAAA